MPIQLIDSVAYLLQVSYSTRGRFLQWIAWYLIPYFSHELLGHLIP